MVVSEVYSFCPVALAGLSIWPSFHVALSNASVFVDFSTKCNSCTVRKTRLSLINTDTNTTVLTRTLPDNQSEGRLEFNCSCFLYAGTFRFLLEQTSTTAVYHQNGTKGESKESAVWWWSSELQVQWPTFHIAVDRAGNNSGSFQARHRRCQSNMFYCEKSKSVIFIFFLNLSRLEYPQMNIFNHV